MLNKEKIFVLATALLLFIGCGSNAVKPTNSPATQSTASVTAQAEPAAATFESLHSAQCPSGDFRGEGIGSSESEALNTARTELAKQINSSVKVSETYSQSQLDVNGQENLSSGFRSQSSVEAVLLNAHDAKVLRVERTAGETGVVVCMSRANAAKGFMEEQRRTADSLDIFCRAQPKHPKHKDEVWNKIQALWNRILGMQSLIDGFGVNNAEFFNSVKATYSKTREERIAYCKATKLHWEDAGNECSEAAFARLSQNVKIEKSECTSGLKLRFTCPDSKCASTSYGIKCEFEPSISIEACSGERFSQLRVKEPVVGSDMNSENKAKDKLFAEFKKANFFKEWESEIKEWVPQCVD